MANSEQKSSRHVRYMRFTAVETRDRYIESLSRRALRDVDRSRRGAKIVLKGIDMKHHYRLFTK